MHYLGLNIDNTPKVRNQSAKWGGDQVHPGEATQECVQARDQKLQIVDFMQWCQSQQVVLHTFTMGSF